MNKTFTKALENNTIEQAMKKAGAKKLHTSLARGYISRKTNGLLKPYKGRFGEGFIHEEPNWKSTSYYYVTYYVFDKN